MEDSINYKDFQIIINKFLINHCFYYIIIKSNKNNKKNEEI